MNILSRVLSLLGAAASLALPTAPAQNLVLNGDFEAYDIREESPGTTNGIVGFGGNTVPFWNPTLASGFLYDDRYPNFNTGVPNVYDGAHSFFLTQNQPLQQSVGLTAGTEYLLSFANSARVGEFAFITSFNLTVTIRDNTQSVSETFVRTPPSGWLESTIRFTAENTGFYTLEFSAPTGGSNSVFLDNISLVAVPEPSASAALAGVAALGWLLCRRRPRARDEK